MLQYERNRIYILKLCQQDVAKRDHVFSIFIQTLAIRCNIMLSSGTLVFSEERVIAIREKQLCTLSPTCDWLPSGSTQHICEV